VDSSHLENLLDEALRETFPASDPIAITIDQPLPRSECLATRASVSRSLAIAEAEPEAKTGAEGQRLTGPFNAMLWGPIQFFNWWSLLMGGGVSRTRSADQPSASK
jgi:hypothetical protein